jgi:hypothetical protein
MLFGLPEQELERLGARRCRADSKPGFPDRIELCDAEPGESLLLLNYTHQPAATPYRASHAIFVREGARERYDEVDQVPEAIRSRLISLRAFDALHMMVDADIAEGEALPGLIERFWQDAQVAYLHAHYARRGCYAARIERV